MCFYASSDTKSRKFLHTISRFPQLCQSICFKDVTRMQLCPVLYVPTIVDDRCYIGERAFQWLENRLVVPVSRNDPNITNPVMSFSGDDGLISTEQQNHQPILHV